MRRGFSIIQLLIVFAVMTLLVVMGLSSLISYKKNQAFQKDTETIVEILTQARTQTLASKNGTQYGVHFSTTTITLFSGSSYVVGAASNFIFPLTSTDIILNISLSGGGTDVVFNRLTGETSQNGSVVVNVPSLGQTKTVTVYKTGLVESQ